MNLIVSEGDQCPICTVGTMELERVENCLCHICPPCSACEQQPLTCSNCGAETGGEEGLVWES